MLRDLQTTYKSSKSICEIYFVIGNGLKLKIMPFEKPARWTYKSSKSICDFYFVIDNALKLEIFVFKNPLGDLQRLPKVAKSSKTEKYLNNNIYI